MFNNKRIKALECQIHILEMRMNLLQEAEILQGTTFAILSRDLYLFLNHFDLSTMSAPEVEIIESMRRSSNT